MFFLHLSLSCWAISLISLSVIHLEDIGTLWLDSISEINVIELHILEGRQFSVVLSFWDQMNLFGICLSFIDSIIFENLHHSEFISVGKVVKVLEETFFFLITFVEIFVLKDRFVHHVFSNWSCLFFEHVSKL